MSNIVKKIPAQSLFVLALVLGMIPVLLVITGLLPSGFMQLGALSASVAGIILAAVESRKGGVRELLRRALIWRVGIGWWLFVLLVPGIASIATMYTANIFGGPKVDLSLLPPIYNLFPIFIFLTILAGFGEEFGWRGFAVPRLQKRYNALITSLIIGTLHFLWHTPLFFIEGTGQYFLVQELGFLTAYLQYALLVIPMGITLSWIFNNTRGSVLIISVYHGSLNAWNSYTGAWLHRSGAVTGAVLWAIISIIVIFLFGAENLSRKHERNVLELEAD
jgi:membrane protease YdiL (CAAX protease family)